MTSSRGHAALPAASSIRREIFTASLAAGAKLLSWLLVLAILFRHNRSDFAMFALVRGTIGLLSYTSLGLSPAMIQLLARVRETKGAEGEPRAIAYSNALYLALLAAGLGLVVTIVYAALGPQVHKLSEGWSGREMQALIVTMGLALLLRLASDAPAAVLQTFGRISTDNAFLFFTEIIWIIISLTAATTRMEHRVAWVTAGYLIASVFLFAGRSIVAARVTGVAWPTRQSLSGSMIRLLLSSGGMISLSQLADFFYTPTDYVLINRLLSPDLVAVFAPAVQIDAGLLLMVSGLASVLLPRAALAHAARDQQAVRRYYLRGTLASVGALLVLAGAMYFASPLLLRLWLGKSSSVKQTLAILPLILMNTVIGGSSQVGRSVLLATGHARAYTIAAILAGALNVCLSYIFVRHMGLGLPGIIYGTICAVMVRCLIWMPIYTLWSIRHPLPVSV